MRVDNVASGLKRSHVEGIMKETIARTQKIHSRLNVATVTKAIQSWIHSTGTGLWSIDSNRLFVVGAVTAMKTKQVCGNT